MNAEDKKMIVFSWLSYPVSPKRADQIRDYIEELFNDWSENEKLKEELETEKSLIQFKNIQIDVVESANEELKEQLLIAKVSVRGLALDKSALMKVKQSLEKELEQSRERVKELEEALEKIKAHSSIHNIHQVTEKALNSTK